MAKYNVEVVQNAEVSKKIPCEKPLTEQLEIMELYTETFRNNLSSSKEKREVECLKVLYPRMFRSIEKEDLFAGRLDFLPIGFGTVTSVGGVGHYCVFAKLRVLQKQLGKEYNERIEALYQFWLGYDLKTDYCQKILTDHSVGPFIDVEYPLIVTARLSGMMLDYTKLLDNGIEGLEKIIKNRLSQDEENEFLRASLECLKIYTDSAVYLANMAREQSKAADNTPKRCQELLDMSDACQKISRKRPETFLEALQALWLYALLAGVINYGRLDEILGLYLAKDLDEGRITQDDAFRYVKSLWTMIENRRTTVNGRVIVGGRGRKNPKAADRFMKIALKAAGSCRYVEPQFTLRVDENTPEEIWDEALDILGKGATYPTIYNDVVNVPAVAYGMRVDEETAARYVPFGCTEFVLWGQSTGTPNVCINLLKILTVYMNEGVDPMDGQYKLDSVLPRRLEDIRSFKEFYDGYKELLDYYMDLSINAQYRSYEIMNEHVSFLFDSILMDDCIERGKALLEGGVRYLGGTCETYGNINASDSLYAIKKLVFEDKKYSLRELETAILNNFEGYEDVRKDCLACDKYGNDLEEVDELANDLYEFVAKGIRDRGIAAGMQYYLIVISNNSLNTEWGLRTDASADGRLSAMYMNPANNPQGGADKSGPTAMLNSLSKFDAKYHAGSVQNIKFSTSMFRDNRALIKALFKTYFKKGGCHLMVTVVDSRALEDAMEHPENYPNLIVRVAGYSAVFVDLPDSVQQELLSRTLYDEGKCRR